VNLILRPAHGVLTAATATALLLLGTGTAHAVLDAEALRATTDHYLFDIPLDQFLTTRAENPYPEQLDWSSDGCTDAPNQPLGFDFTGSCNRHDFGYRNYQKQGRFTEDNRRKIDDGFKADMYSKCGDNRECKATADLYYSAVREFGASGSPIAEIIHALHLKQAVAPTDQRSASGQVDPVHELRALTPSAPGGAETASR
jgi:hypothetical protein